MTSNDDPVPELPFLSDVVDIAKSDLEASRALLQRLLSVADASLATAVTVTGLFGGLAFTNKSRLLTFAAIPLMFVFAYLDGLHWAHFRRVSARVRALERLFHSYVVALRETKTARPQAIRDLRGHIDRYQFGVERAFEPVGLRSIWMENRSRPRWWLYGSVALILLICGIWLVPDKEPEAGSVCTTDASGAVVEYDGVPSVVNGSIAIVPCPTSEPPPKDSS